MSQIYTSYLAKSLDAGNVRVFLLGRLKEPSSFDWQKMWVLAALLQVDKADDASVKAALDLLKDANRHPALRAVAASYVGRFGDHARRKALGTIYPSVSNYIQAAIYYSSKAWPRVERSNARATWGGHGPLHSMLTAAMSKK